MRIQPTPEQLQQAFAAVRLPGWPSTYAEAASDAVRAQLVQAAAVRMALGLGVARKTPPAARQTPARTAAAPLRPLTVDRKRLAAGDRDD